MDLDRGVIFDGYEVHEWKPGDMSLWNAERYLRHILTPEHFEQLAALEWVEERDVDALHPGGDSPGWSLRPTDSRIYYGGSTLVEAVARARGESDG